ncbi:MAG: hypothetical protein A2W19_17485 [Spirochaetes bacterium RBG_16_49_21]|nr:MAG: hypothetical protein A2W19_17485 [Spirochaetes bacterium RBG_16_49_21]
MKKKFYERLKKNLRPFDFGKEIGRELGTTDVGKYLRGIRPKKEKLFLRTFDSDAVYDLLKRVNLLAHLAELGYGNVKIRIDVDDAEINYLNLYYDTIDPENILFDLRLSESRFIPDEKYFGEGRYDTYDVIVIEWLSAQDPRRPFSSGKPQLPGQRYPGLGILRHCFEIMSIMGRSLGKDGFIDVPDHIHGAIMYAKKFKFFDPAHEGVVRALMRDLKDYSLSDISWGILTRSIIEKYKNQPQPYDPSEQVYYISDRLRNYFHSSKYRTLFRKYYGRKHFKFNYEEMLEKKEKILETKSMVEL